MARQPRLLRGLAIAALLLLATGIALIAVGIFLPPVIKRKLETGILDNIVWSPHSPSSVDARFRGGVGPGTPYIYFKVYMFNISNLEDVKAGAKPKLEQVGPFVYRKVREKLDVLWSKDGKVQFKEYQYHRLVPELTGENLSAPIATFNMALLGVLAQMHSSASTHWQPFLDLLMGEIERFQAKEHMHGLFTVRPAEQLLWGYEDPLLETLARLLPPGFIPTTSVALLHNMSAVAEALKLHPTVVNTGHNDLNHTWNMEVDRGFNSVTSWPCPAAVEGSDALQFRPGLALGDRLRVWVGDIFRGTTLAAEQQVALHGVRLLRFMMDPSDLDPNPCYNQGIKGLFNITSPLVAGPTGSPNISGPPVLVSLPMFCLGDSALAAAVEGVHCDPEQHLGFIDVEPITGITMRAYKRLMMSSQVSDLGSTLEPQVASNLTIPMFWAEEYSEINQEQAGEFKSQVYRAKWLAYKSAHWFWLLGGLLILFGIILAVLTVELGGDPDQWHGAPVTVPGLLASARQTFGGEVKKPGPTAGPGGGVGDVEEQQLLLEEGAAAGEGAGEAATGSGGPTSSETGGGGGDGEIQPTSTLASHP